jgi:tetratricopeptide (TPR) repeat protein
MGFFDRLFGKGNSGKDNKPGPIDPDDLRAQLFDAAASGDLKRVEQLCRAHRATVVADFPAWQKVPEATRGDQAALQRYGRGLVTVAQLFAERLGDVSLLERLIGQPQDNPLVRWQDQLGKAQALVDEMNYARAKTLLTDLLAEVRGLQGSGVERLLPITLGRIAACHFHAGEADEALRLFTEALALCERAADLEGVQAYLGSLYNVHRWLGQPAPAADAARRLADLLESQGQHDEAALHRRQAERVAAGEPPNRVVAVVGERTVELDDLEGTPGRLRFVFERDRITLDPAREWTRRGEQLGGAGDHAEALAAFEKAAAADPHDPHSRYQAAFTLLHLRRYAEAESLYAEVERLAPGWFHCRADRWLAAQLAAGTIDHDTFLALHTLQDGDLAPEARLALAEKTLQRARRVPLLHLHHAKALAELGRKPEALAALRAGLAADPEPDARTRLLVDLANLTQEPSERAALLRQAEALAGNLVAAATARVLLRAAR